MRSYGVFLPRSQELSAEGLGLSYPSHISDPGSYYPTMRSPGFNLQRLRELIQERDTTPRAVSRAITDGQNPYIVRDILSGKAKNPRSDTVAKLADHLGVDAAELVSQSSAWGDKEPRRVAPSFLPVRYKVQAGLWFEPDGEEPAEDLLLPVLPLPKYAAFPQWLEKVVGDSANMRLSDGCYIHVVDAIELGYAPKHDDWVVVVRERDQGAVRERTVKQVEVGADGQVRLWPRSTNPRWQEPVDFRAGARPGEDVTAEIVGLVVGSYDPHF